MKNRLSREPAAKRSIFFPFFILTLLVSILFTSTAKAEIYRVGWEHFYMEFDIYGAEVQSVTDSSRPLGFNTTNSLFIRLAQTGEEVVIVGSVYASRYIQYIGRNIDRDMITELRYMSYRETSGPGIRTFRLNYSLEPGSSTRGTHFASAYYNREDVWGNDLFGLAPYDFSVGISLSIYRPEPDSPPPVVEPPAVSSGDLGWDGSDGIFGAPSYTVPNGQSQIASATVSTWQSADGSLMAQATENLGYSTGEGVILSPASLTLELGTSYQLNYTITGSDSFFSINSSNPSIATVSGNGLVTASSTGTATITVTTQSGLRASSAVTVVEPGGSNQSTLTRAVNWVRRMIPSQRR